MMDWILIIYTVFKNSTTVKLPVKFLTLALDIMDHTMLFLRHYSVSRLVNGLTLTISSWSKTVLLKILFVCFCQEGKPAGPG